MIFEDWYETAQLESHGKHTVADLEAAYTAGAQAERDKSRTLATAVLEAHDGHACNQTDEFACQAWVDDAPCDKSCPHFICRCPACTVAREVMEESGGR